MYTRRQGAPHPKSCLVALSLPSPALSHSATKCHSRNLLNLSPGMAKSLYAQPPPHRLKFSSSQIYSPSLS